jgi:predicted CoA-substrate-specific enzyme activase
VHLEGIGLDVGSTTAKVVAARAGRIVHRAYRRHRGECLECARSMLTAAHDAVGTDAPRFVTGSAGARLARDLGAVYVHEVHAVALAVRAHEPHARTVIELGGQDAKLIHIEGPSLSSEMNERCAAGTGATLDRCLYRLGVAASVLQHLTLPEHELPLVSAKCGVFAETDLVNLIKAGVPRELVLAALLDAVVRGNLAVLARGSALPPKVLLLGGPHAFFPALASVWRRHLAARWRERGVLHGADDDVRVPPLAEYFAAEGAMRSADSLERLDSARAGTARRSTPRRLSLASTVEQERILPGLVTGGEPVDETLRRHRGLPPLTSASSSAGLALGIDAGSTTIKAVVLDERDVPRVTAYRRAERGPLEDAQAILSQIATLLGSDVERVTSFGVTGYAAGVLGPVLGADAAPVETLAHARSTTRYVPRADVLCDIGGQDIKVLCLAGGDVTRFHLSSQCAAGNGALLEATADDLGVPMDRYAEVAFSARRAPELALGCAVFLHTERVSLQARGFTPAEILAGMAGVLPRNVWENVVAEPSLQALGRVFVLSGGVQRNRAAVKAQIDYILGRHPNAEIVVHPFPGEAGAIGAAQIARDACRAGRTRFVGFQRAAEMTFSARSDASTRCHRCPSACPRTIVDATGLARERVQIVTGHACERGDTLETAPASGSLARASTRGARNLLRVEAARLFGRARAVRPASHAGAGLRVAIPRVLSMYRSAPFFTHYLESIGVARGDILVGDATSEDLWKHAAGHGTVDACFPVKVAQAHVAQLLARQRAQPFDVLLFPVLTHAVTAITACADTASCPVVAATPLVTRAAFGVDERGRLPGGARLLTPTLVLSDPPRFEAQLLAAMRTVVPGLTADEHAVAVREGRGAQRAFEQALERDGAAVLARARADQRAAFVMLARPYHADPGIHHDIGSELRALGRTTLSIRALPKDPATLVELGAGEALALQGEAGALTNSGDGEKLFAARVVAAHPHLCAIEVSSFKCGQDASLYGEVEAIARGGGKPFLALHDLDETRPTGSLRLRLRTFLDAVERYEERLRATACAGAEVVS